MNLTETDIESLSNDELNWLAAEAMGFIGLGYYGPTKSKGAHLDNERFDTKVEALEKYREYWKGDPGCVNGADMDEDDVHLCHWKDNWGPLTAEAPADGRDDLWGLPFEDWFFKSNSQFTMQVLKSKVGITVEISHDTHDHADAYFDGKDESRLRTMAILETLKKLSSGND